MIAGRLIVCGKSIQGATPTLSEGLLYKPILDMDQVNKYSFDKKE